MFVNLPIHADILRKAALQHEYLRLCLLPLLDRISTVSPNGLGSHLTSLKRARIC
jgi:hypothetical protein